MPGPYDPNAYRADPRSLVPAARRLYEEGKRRKEVLETIYGVDLPPEAPLFLRDYVGDAKPLQASWLNHPWELMIPLDEGGPRHEVDPRSLRLETRAFAQAPNVLLLGITGYDGEHSRSVFGYDLDELRAGRPTVVGLEGKDEVPESGAAFTVFGPSLVEVFRGLITSAHALMTKWIEMNVYMYTQEDLEELLEQRRGIEALQRELAGQD